MRSRLIHTSLLGLGLIGGVTLVGICIYTIGFENGAMLRAAPPAARYVSAGSVECWSNDAAHYWRQTPTGSAFFVGRWGSIRPVAFQQNSPAAIPPDGYVTLDDIMLKPRQAAQKPHAPRVTILYHVKPDSPFDPRAGMSKEYTVADVEEESGAAPGIGIVDGINKVFSLSYSPLGQASVQVFINGLLQYPENYTLSGKVITFNTAPAVGDGVLVLYRGEFSQ